MLKTKISNRRFLKILKENNILLSVYAYKTNINIKVLKDLKLTNQDAPKYLLQKLYSSFKEQLNKDTLLFLNNEVPSACSV